MSTTDDLRVTQLLASRLCHDLVGTASAVNTGLELLDEMGADDDGSALQLVRNSGRQIAQRLQFFRMAFGAGGGAGGGGIEAFADAKALADDYLSSGNVRLDWPVADMRQDEDAILRALPGDAATGAAKLVLNLILIGMTCLPRGGDVTVRVAGLDEGVGFAATARGKSAALKDDMRAALSGAVAVDDLSAHTVQPYFSQQLVAALGGRLELDADPADEGAQGVGEVRIAVLIA